MTTKLIMQILIFLTSNQYEQYMFKVSAAEVHKSLLVKRP